MTNDHRNIIACVPDGAPGYIPGEDYILICCPRCQRRCWIGPKGKSMRDAGEAHALCALCVIRLGLIAEGEKAGVIDPAAKARCDERVRAAAFATMTPADVERLGR